MVAPFSTGPPASPPRRRSRKYNYGRRQDAGVVTSLNDYNIAMELQAWLRDEQEHIERRFAHREKVFKALMAAGVDMPFETIQVVRANHLT